MKIFLVYFAVIFCGVLSFFMALIPFFIKKNTPDVSESSETYASIRLKRALKYQCPSCGEKFKSFHSNCKCVSCGKLFHPDYILTIYEDTNCQ